MVTDRAETYMFENNDLPELSSSKVRSHMSFVIQKACLLWQSCHWLSDVFRGLVICPPKLNSPTPGTLSKEEERLAAVNGPDIVTPADTAAPEPLVNPTN